MVGTDELLTHAAVMRGLRQQAERWQAQVDRIRRLDSTPSPAWTAANPGLHVLGLMLSIDDVAETARVLANALVTSAEEYGRAERRVEDLARSSAAGMASLLGHLAPLLALAAVPALTSGALAFLLACLATGTAPSAGGARLATWVTQHPGILTDPLLVAVVRALVSSADDAAGGAVGVPLPVSALLGDDGLGVFGVAGSAAALATGARAVGGLAETPVTVRRIGSVPRSPPPTGMAELARRIPVASATGPQVRIERYGSALEPAWVVYVGGTADWNPVAGTDPWDATSNIAAMARESSGSRRAVVAAMRRAGVRPGDPVIGVGHSQGGLVLAQVAASERFHTVALATFGSPSAHVPVPESIPVLAAEHSDDLVPALGGAARDATGDGNRHLIARREAFPNTDPPAGVALPAHSMAAYVETAELIDASPEPRLVRFRELLTVTVGADAGTVSLWRGSRTRAGR